MEHSRRAQCGRPNRSFYAGGNSLSTTEGLTNRLSCRPARCFGEINCYRTYSMTLPAGRRRLMLSTLLFIPDCSRVRDSIIET